MVRSLLVLTLVLCLVPAARASCPGLALTEAATVTTGVNPVDIAAADFNHDGNVDIVTPSSSGNNVLVRFGNGNGTFQTGTPYASSGTTVVGVAAGDLNGDGWADMALANYGSDTISVLLNQQNGTFAAPTTRTLSGINANPWKVIIADMDGDGKNDAVVLGGFTTVEIQYGNGDGTFRTTATILTVPLAVNGFAVADFNGDGKMDVASISTGDPVGVIEVFTNNGNLTYTKNTYNNTAVYGLNIAAGDFNGDGKPDLAVANNEPDEIAVLLNNGSGAFGAAVTYPADGDPQALVAVDLNEDGILDLAAAGRNSSTFPILRGNSNGTFQAAVYQFLSLGWSHMATIITADFNNNGRPDVALVEYDVNKVLPFLNNCSPRHAAVTLASSANPSNYGDAVTLTATLTAAPPGTPTGSVTFFDGATNLGTSPISGTTASLIVPRLALGAHTLTATYSGDGTFGSSSTRNPFTQTVQRGPFGAPLDVTATGNSNTFVITIQWVGTLGVDHYQVDRLYNGTWSTIGTPAGESFNDIGATANDVFVYRVRAFDAGMTPSPYGNYDAATNYAFAVATIPAGRVISAVDLADLRTTMNSLRVTVGLTPLAWTDDPVNGVLVKAAHLNELRVAESATRSYIGLPTLSYANTLAPGALIRAIDFQELRRAVQ